SRPRGQRAHGTLERCAVGTGRAGRPSGRLVVVERSGRILTQRRVGRRGTRPRRGPEGFGRTLGWKLMVDRRSACGSTATVTACRHRLRATRRTLGGGGRGQFVTSKIVAAPLHALLRRSVATRGGLEREAPRA